MAKIDITRAELVWPGKCGEDGTPKEVRHVSLPFQVIETVKLARRGVGDGRGTGGAPGLPDRDRGQDHQSARGGRMMVDRAANVLMGQHGRRARVEACELLETIPRKVR